MPEVRVKRGLRANLPSQDNAGVLLVTTDTRELWVGQGAGSPLLCLSRGVARVTAGAWAATINIDGRGLDIVRVTLAGATTINMVNGEDGQRLVLQLAQDATGGRSVSTGTGFRFSGNPGSFVASSSPNVVDQLELIYNAGAGVYDVLSVSDGHSSAGGPGASIVTGTSTLDFGSAPGNDYVTVVVTGQAAITTNSKITVHKRLEATSDHTKENIVVMDLDLIPGDIVPGTGFTIHALSRLGQLTGLVKTDWTWT